MNGGAEVYHAGVYIYDEGQRFASLFSDIKEAKRYVRAIIHENFVHQIKGDWEESDYFGNYYLATDDDDVNGYIQPKPINETAEQGFDEWNQEKILEQKKLVTDGGAATGKETRGTKQVFECEICGQRYEIHSDYSIDRITVECENCGDISAWCFPLREGASDEPRY